MTLPFVGSSRGSTGSSGLFGRVFGNSVSTGARKVYQSYGYSSSTYYYIPSNLVSVAVTDETRLGYGAFYDCWQLTDLALNDGIADIGPYALYNCQRLPEIEIPSTVTNIDTYAFQYCYRLGEIRLPEGIGTVKSYSFDNCTGATNLVISSTVTNIATYAFRNCSGLAELVVPDTVQTISYGAFAGCYGLRRVTLPFVGGYRGSTDGSWAANFGYIFYNSVSTGALSVYQRYDGGSNAYSYHYIPSNLVSVVVTDETRLGYGAFYGCSMLESVTLNDGLTRIGPYAFYGCAGLPSLSIPESVSTISSSAFSGCSRLEIDAIPAATKAIGDYAFSGCDFKEIVIPEGVETIGSYAFQNCYAATNLVISSTVTNIGTYAFQNCRGLAELVVPDTVRTIGQYAFAGCGGLRSVSLPFVGYCRGNSGYSGLLGYVFGSGYGMRQISQSSGYDSSGHVSFGTYYLPSNLVSVAVTDETRLGHGAFSGCWQLTDLALNDGIADIGPYALYSCQRLSEVAIPATVTNVGVYAFQSCSGLGEIRLPEGVEIVRGYVFDECTGLTNLVISSTVTNIATYAFRNCSGLAELVVPDTVQTISYGAFAGCYGLRSMTLPFVGACRGIDGYGGNFGYIFYDVSTGAMKIRQVYAGSSGSYADYWIPSNLVSVVVTDETRLGYGAFYGCTMLESVTLNNGLTRIGPYAFYGCAGLTECNIPQTVSYVGDHAFDGCNSALFDTTTIAGLKLLDGWAIGCTGAPLGDLNLSGVRGLANAVFSGNTSLTSVILPTDMNTIGTSVFYGCSNLKRVTMADGVTSIGQYAFASCYSLTDLSIPSSVTNIENYAFQSCSGITELDLPEGLVSIGTNAFAYCSNLRTVNVPTTLSKVLYGAFESCSKITRVNCSNLSAWFGISFGSNTANPVNYAHGLYVNGTLIKDLVIPEDVSNIKFGTFYNCTNMTSVTMHDGVTNIAASAFCYCSGITNVVLSRNLATIGSSAFYGCRNLPEIEIPESVTRIYSQAFGYCYSLTNAVIPEGVVTIGASTFYNCTNLTAIAVPSTVLDITNSVFYGCSALRDVSLPPGVTNIRSSAFCDCRSLQEIELPANLKAIGASAFQNDIGLIRVVIPEGVTSIGDNAFYGCTNLSEVVFPSTLRTIGQYAFYNCRSLTNVVIADGVASIGQYAFGSCSKLAHVTIPQSVTSIGQYAFNGCTNLNVTFADGTTKIPDSAFYPGCAGLSTVDIPSTVTNIGSYAFYGCSNLANPAIPASVTTIGRYAFYGCNRLTNIVIPEGVTSVGEYAFANCANLVNVTLPSSLKTFGQYAFNNCIKLSNLAMSEGITAIGQNAFSGCSALTSVDIPSTVTSIGSYAFQNCRGLNGVVIPASVKSIGSHAFEGCKGMISVDLTDELASIGDYAFSGCTNLTALVIPKSVTTIGQYAFNACTNLANVAFMATNTASASSAFRVVDSTWEVQSDGTIRSASITHNASSSLRVLVSGGGTLTFDWKVSSESGCDFLSYYVDGDRCANPISGSVGWQTISIPLAEGSHAVSWVYSKDVSVNRGSDCGWIRNVSLSGDGVNASDFNVAGLYKMTIAAYAFNNCIGLSFVNIKDLSAWCRISFGNLYANPLEYAHDLYANGTLVQDLTLPEDTYSINPWAFGGASVTNVVIPNSASVTTNSFWHCRAVKAATLPATHPMSRIFPHSYTALKKVDVADGAVRVCASAFTGCSTLGTVAIPASVTNIADNAFVLCPSLKGISVATDNTYYKDVDGVLYTKDGTKIACCPAGVTGTYALPDLVSEIGSYAFNGCGKVTGISIPAGVAAFPLTAFEGCISLLAFVVDADNAYYRDIDGVVFTKDGKTLVLYPRGRRGNYTIPDGVTAIADSAFAGCVHLTGVTLPESMRKIGTSAFEGCTAMSNIDINENLDEIGSYAFRNCTSLTSLIVPDNVIKLGKEVFAGCVALANLVLPDGLQLEPETLSGTISGTRTLSRGVVYHVTGNITVNSGATLNIPSGAILKMAAGVSITVNSGGTLNAQGTRSSPVVFTSIKDDSIGGDTNGDGDSTHAESGDWARVYAGGLVNMNYCTIRYCNNNSDYGAIHGTGGAVTFDNGIIEYSVYECVRMNSGRFVSRNSVFRESSMGFGYYGGSGVYVYNGIVADCTIACRASNKHFYNTVFYRCQTFLESTSSSCDHCVFFNPPEYGAQSAAQVGANGNIWADPRFVDADDGDFRIRADSPCIDAGDGMVASATDYYGQTRQTVYEDATGTPDTRGNYPDIGIHEVMPREVKSDVDLAVENVIAPETLVVGEKATVTWTVKNLGSEAASGSWGDKVELVCANGSVVSLGTLPVSATLPAGGARTFSGTWTVPSAQVGTIRVRVTANANRDIFEGTLTANNTTESQAMTLTLPELAIPESGTASFNLAPCGSVGYSLGEGFANGGLLIVRTVTAGANSGVNVWTGNGQVPTADIFYAAAIPIADGISIVRVPAGGDAYVSLANDGSNVSKVEVEAETGAFLIFDTGVTTAPNDGMVNLSLYGNGFAEDMEVWIAKGGMRYGTTELTVFDAIRAVASFDVTGLAAGAYDVYVKRGDDETSVPLLALTQQRIGPKWSCKLDIASAIRSSREYVGYLEYANTGDMPLDAPYVKIMADSGSFIRFGSADAWGDTLELMATSETYPASQLKPGETRRIPFRYKTISSSLSIECGYAQEDADAFPWDANAAYMRPSWANDELWGLSLAVLKSNIGATWNDYLARMRMNCDHLAKIGQPTYRLDRIWQLEINEALGVDHAVSTLATNTDLARSGRGFGLALSRSYGSGLYRRLRKGIFGYGWSDNYSAYAELQNSGATLALHNGRGSTYLFEKVNGKWTPEDARDKTTCAETTAEYVLTYRSGTVQRIAKDNMRVSSMRDNLDNAIVFTYNSDNSLATVEHCDGQSLSFTYANGLLVSATDDQGRTTRYEYSGDLLVKVTAFNGLITQYRYYAADGSATSRALRQIIYPDGTTRDFSYGADGFVSSIAKNGNQQITRIVHDGIGSYSIVAPNGGVSSRLVGWAGEQLQTVNALGEKTTCEYTADSLLESIVGPTGKRSKTNYDEDGQIVKSVDVAGAETGFGYTPDFGNLASVTDARGNVFKYGHDKQGHPNSIEYVDGSMERIMYSDRGDITNAVNRRGQSISYTYDDEGRMLSKVWNNGRAFTWAYDAKGNCTNATDSATGTVFMEYDENERLTRIVHPKGRGFAYEYDELGRTVSRTTLGGTGSVPSAADIQRYAYDSIGRLSRMTDGNGNLYVENAYDPTTGWLVTQTYGNGTIVSNAYDILGRTVGIYHLGGSPSSATVLAFFEYAYDAEGRRISQTTAEGVERYTYDTVGQLTDVYYPDGTEEHFTYDAVGNRLTANGDTYTANNLNQYIAISGGPTSVSAIEYDLDGNMTRNGDTRYYYDIQNRLVAVTNTTKDIRWSCEYDVFGNRTKVIDHGTARESLFVQGSLASAAAEFNTAGNLSTRHILLDAVRLADVVISSSLSQTCYYHADGLASARLITDANGNAIGTASYCAFGALRVSSGTTTPTGWVGTLGVVRDVATGLIFMRNRYYSESKGGFIQPDRTGIRSGDLNLYRYCENNPINYCDITGNDSVEIYYAAEDGSPIMRHRYTFSSSDGSRWEYRSHYQRGDVVYCPETGWEARLDRDMTGEEVIRYVNSRQSEMDDETWAYWQQSDLRSAAKMDFRHGSQVASTGGSVLQNMNPVSQFDPFSAAYSLRDVWNLNHTDFPILPNGETRVQSSVRVSSDPNEMSGPAGIGEQRYIKQGDMMDYTIYFENQTNATAAAIKIAVTLPKDVNLDWSTLELGEIAFGDHTDTGFVEDKSTRTSKYALSDSGCEVRTTVTESDSDITWNIRIWDPNTLDHFPDDFNRGVLPPNNPETHCGEGHISFRVKVKDDAEKDSVVRASAVIVFDDNDPIETDPAWWNTVAERVSLAESLDAESLEWTFGGAAEWWPEAASEAVGGYLARCGSVPNGTNAWLSTVVDGPGTLTFKWRSALASRNTKYQFMVDGEVQGMLTGVSSWRDVSVEVFGEGLHEIKWRLMAGRNGADAADWAGLDNVSWKPTIPPTLAEALNTNLVWQTGGDVLWRGVARESLADSRDAWAVVSGLGDDGTSFVQTRVYGSGVLSFDWAISCEKDYDWMEFSVDGEVNKYISGTVGWTKANVEITGKGWHVVRWEYVKDEMDDPELVGNNIARLDNVVWESEDTPPAITETQLTPVPVPYAELEERFGSYLERANGDYEAAAKMTGRNGYAIWESYVAGLDPDKEDSKFRAKIEIVDGKPVVTWEPDTPELRSSREYITYGKKTLLDRDWTPVTDTNKDQFNFFKVEVKMK